MEIIGAIGLKLAELRKIGCKFFEINYLYLVSKKSE